MMTTIKRMISKETKRVFLITALKDEEIVRFMFKPDNDYCDENGESYTIEEMSSSDSSLIMPEILFDEALQILSSTSERARMEDYMIEENWQSESEKRFIRNPEQLELERLILKALVCAEWKGEAIAGFISAQRRDGILSNTIAPYRLEIELTIWRNTTPAHVRTQCRLPEALTRVAQNNED